MRLGSRARAALFLLFAGCSAPAPDAPLAPRQPTQRAGGDGEPSASSAVAPAPGPAARPTPGVLSPLYAPLFEKGRRFTFHVATESSHYDPNDKAAAKDGTVIDQGEAKIVCTVTEARERAGARVAVLDCGEDGNQSFAMGKADVTPAGVYLANDRGLFRFPLGVAPPANLDSVRALLPRTPRAAREEQKDGRGELVHEIVGHTDGTWCSIADDFFGDASHDEACFQEGRGLVRLVGGWDGASTHFATFDLVSP